MRRKFDNLEIKYLVVFGSYLVVIGSIPGGDWFLPGGDWFLPGGDWFLPRGVWFPPGLVAEVSAMRSLELGSFLMRRLTLRLKEVRRPTYRSTITTRYHLQEIIQFVLYFITKCHND